MCQLPTSSGLLCAQLRCCFQSSWWITHHPYLFPCSSSFRISTLPVNKFFVKLDLSPECLLH
ncbi:hypothetical protein ATANTOWER_024550, partial [Ataeniobius toweri]|nr:hypothetical protein [Ataeniobius toweri]